jgi:hypothetical protein
MTLPRPVLIAILGLALCAAAFLATRSANDTGSVVQSTPGTTAAKPAPAKHGATAAKPKHAAPAKPQVAAKPKPDAASKPAPAAGGVNKVLPVLKALGRGNVVVFFFTRPGAADDTGAREAVKSLAHEKGVSVFKAGFDELETYRPVLSGAGVSQVPAIVIVRAGHDARLIEGYVDAGTLRQNVADARR